MPGANLEVPPGPKAYPNFRRCRLRQMGKQRSSFHGQTVGHGSFDPAVESDILHRSTHNEQAIVTLQHVSVPVPDYGRTRLIRLRVPYQVSFNWLRVRQRRHSFYWYPAAPGSGGNDGNAGRKSPAGSMNRNGIVRDRQPFHWAVLADLDPELLTPCFQRAREILRVNDRVFGVKSRSGEALSP